MIRRPSPAESGFALIEAMVAAALFAGMTALLFQTVSSTVAATRHVAQSRRAILIAQSVLAQFQNSGAPPVAPSGSDGPYRWRAQIGPYAGQAVDNSRAMEQLTVTVTDADTGRVITSLSTLRLASR
jgi:type II secretory pathway pseudopilin PulG